jgi:hypothetical protein
VQKPGVGAQVELTDPHGRWQYRLPAAPTNIMIHIHIKRG